jgi:hypothetical protein
LKEEEQKSIVIYKSWKKPLRKLSLEQKGRIFDALLDFPDPPFSSSHPSFFVEIVTADPLCRVVPVGVDALRFQLALVLGVLWAGVVAYRVPVGAVFAGFKFYHRSVPRCHH